MAQLNTFTGGDVDIDNDARLVTITGGVVDINGALDAPDGFDDWGGWRILCTSHGRPSGTGGSPSTFTPSAYANVDIGNSNNAGEITLSSTNYNLTDTGKRFTFTNLGGYSATGIAINTRYYIRKVGDNKIRFYASEANALNDVSPLAFTTNGTIGNMRIQYDNGRGGFRSVSGASGTLGGGKHSLTIIETANGNLYGEDNYTQASGNRRARFFGDGTNVLKYRNIVWIIEATSTRYDFDFYRGAAGDGSNGPKCELSGVDLIQRPGTGVPAAFNHFSSQSSIVIHPEVGYGLRIANHSNGHAIEFTHRIQDGAKVEGLVIRNVTAAHNNGATAARVTAQLNQVPANGEFVLSNLNSPSVSDVSGSSDKTFVLIDPVGQPTITNSWGRHTYLEIRRTVPFVFTGAEVPSSPAVTLHAIAAVGGQDASAVVSGSSGTIQLRTQRTDNNTTLNWTDRNEYRFFMTSLGLRKYSLTTTQTIANNPETITAALTADTLPNGNAISSITAPTNNNPPDTLAEVLRAIKDVEVANPTTSGFPTTSLAYVEGNAVKIHDDYSLTLDSTASTLIEIATDPNGLGGQHIDLKTGTSLGNGTEGLTTIDASGTGETISTTSVTEAAATFLKDSTGQKSIVAVTNNMGAAARFAVVNTTDGTTLASATVNNGATGNLAIATKGLTTGYRLVSKRPGYNYYSAAVDLTGGGLKSFTAPPQAQIVQPDGSASYQSVTVPNTLTVAITNSGSTPKARIECGNATFSARQIFKAYEDEIATADGDKYMGLGGAQMTYTLSALKGNEIVLGAHTKVKRKASTDTNATIRASLYAPDDMPVDNDDGNGDVMTIEGLDVEAVAKAIVVDTDYDPSESGVQSIWSKLNEIESGGGGGSTLTAQQVWEYSAGSGRTLTSAAGLTASQATQLQNASDKATQNNNALTNSTYGLAAMKTAQDMIPTTSGGSGPEVLYSFQGPALIAQDAPSAVDITNDTWTIDEDWYDSLSNGDSVDISTYGGYTFTSRKNSFVLSGVARTYYIRKVDDTNHRIKLYQQQASDAINDIDPIDISGNGTPSSVVWGENNAQSTANNAPSNFTTPAWEVSNIDDYYFKIDGGYVADANVVNRSFRTTASLEVSVEDSADGTFGTWHSVPDSSWSEWNSSENSGSPASGYMNNNFTQIYNLSVLSGINSGAITNGKYIKFRLKYSFAAFGVSSGSGSVDSIENAYLNLTILPSLTVSGGASTGGLNQQQSTWLSNVNAAVTSGTHGNSAIKSAVDNVPASVWGRDLSGTAVDDSAADLLKDASTSGGGGGGGATASQIWGFSMPSTPTSGSVAEYLKGAHDDAGAAKDDLANTTDGLGALKTAIDDIESGGGGGASAADIWGYDITDLTGDKAGAILNTAAADATAAKDDLANATDGLGALKSAIDGVATDVDSIQSDVEDSTHGLAALEELIDDIPTTSPPSADSIATEVWGEDLSGTASAGTAAALIKNASTSGFDSSDRTKLSDIETAVEAIPTTAAPSKEDIAAAVLAATLHEGQRAVLNFTPTEHNNDSFKIRTVDANQLRNGDRINFIQNGGFTNNGAQIEPSEEFYCYKAYDDIFLYANTEDALVGNSSYVRLGTGTVANVRLRRPADSRYITVQSALDLIVSNSASAIHGIDAVIDAVSDIGGDVSGLTSANFVETGLSMKQALQITTAILAGRLTITANGTRYRFHRLDADETAAIEADAGEAGRTTPTRDPT